jgi:hypothetical protein
MLKLKWVWFSILNFFFFYIDAVYIVMNVKLSMGGHCGHDRIVVGFIVTYAISAYHH